MINRPGATEYPNPSLLVLSLGSNINAAGNLRLARAALLSHFGNMLCSTVYESEAVGFKGDNFLNLAALIKTDLPLPEIAHTLKQIEDRLGRDRRQPKFSDRIIDIDVLIYSDNIAGDADGHDCGMQLPRAEITRNAFVLQPLAELLPTHIHAPTGKSYGQLWQAFDKSQQQLWPVKFDWTPDPTSP